MYHRPHPVVEQRCERSTQLGQLDDGRRFRRTNCDEQEARRQRHFRQFVDYCRRPETEIRDDEIVKEVDMSNE